MERQGDDVEREVCLADRLIKPVRGKTNFDFLLKWSFHSNEITEGQCINHKC